MKRKCIGVLLSAILISQIMVTSCKASQNDDAKETYSIIEIKEQKDIQEKKKDIQESDLVTISQNNLKKISGDSLEEILDDGSDLLVIGDDMEQINEYINLNLISKDEDNVETTEDESNRRISNDKEMTMGCYIRTDGEDIFGVPITATYAIREGEKEEDYDIEEIKKDISLDTNEVYNNLISKDTTEEFLEQISKSDLARLQGSTSLGNSFHDGGKYTYVYGKGTGIQVGGSRPSGYDKIAALDVHSYLVGSGTKKNTSRTWDTLYSDVKVSGMGGRWIKEFVVQNRLYSSKNNEVYDYTIPEGDKTETISFGGDFGLSAQGVSGKIATGVTYTINPDKCSITTKGGDKYVKQWIVKPNKSKANQTYRFRPAMLIKNDKGTTEKQTVSVRVHSLKVEGTWVYRFIENYWGNEYVCLEFKNHKKA